MPPLKISPIIRYPIMRNREHRWIRGLGAVVITLVLGMAITPAEVRSAAELADLPRLADSGEFSRVLNVLRTDPQDEPATAKLIQELESYEQHQLAHSARRQELFQQTIEKMRQLSAEGKLEDALVSAVDAHGLADDPEAMLHQEDVQSLVTLTEAAAADAEQRGDWLEVLNLYRLLNLLFDDFASYRPHVNRAAKHVRALRIYAPQTLEALYVGSLRTARGREAGQPSRYSAMAGKV